jgi:hypothetical protein
VHAFTDRVDHTCDLVSGHNRKRHAGEVPFLCVRVAVADAARLHLDANFSWRRFRNLPLVKLEWTTGFGYLHDAHSAVEYRSQNFPNCS